MAVPKEVSERAKGGKPPPSSVLLGAEVKASWILLMRPVEDYLIERKIHPDVLTMTSLLISAIAGVLFHFGDVFLAGVVLIAGSTFDMLDGRVARALNISSRSGAYLDSVLDRVSEMLILLGLLSYFRHSIFVYVVFLTLAFSMMVSYTKARAEGVGVDSEVGMMQRAERIVYLGVASLFNFFGNLLTGFAGIGKEDYILKLALVLIALFSLVTSWQRITHVLRVLKEREAGETPKKDS